MLDLNDESDSGPDPITQGAELVDLVPGGTSEHDACFGFGTEIDATIEKDGDVVRAEFVAEGLAPSGSELAAAAAPELTYTLVCRPEGEVTSAAGLVATGTGNELSVVGAVEDVAYTCAVAATVDGLLVARSATAVVGEVPDGSAGTPVQASQGGGAPGTASLSFVG